MRYLQIRPSLKGESEKDGVALFSNWFLMTRNAAGNELK